MRDLARLLEPDRLDALPEVGAGRSGRVLRAGRYAVKVPHPFDSFRRQVDREAATLALLDGGPVPIPRLHLRLRKRGFVRDFVEGPSLLELLREGPLSPRLRDEATRTFEACEAYREDTGTVLDFTPPNLVWDGARGALVLLDLGPRRDPSPFVGRASPELLEALQAYAAKPPPTWRDFHLPPSGRFGVGVPLGPDPGARVVWRNQACLDALGVDLSDEELVARCGLSTEAAPHTWRWASRYQDARGFEDGDPQGDGRVVYAGRLASGHEATLKGVGPTPLAWRGMKYHEDGRVSFQRTLWEAAVCEGLCRLGFDAPRVGAVLTSCARTVDNSEIDRPAGIALRISRTHFRLGHLYRFAEDAGAFLAISRAAGRAAVRPDFSPRNRRHLTQLVLRFSTKLGRVAGRTEFLNIVAFNPTVGNVRVDGHPIDFSTVRFLDRTVPDWRFMESTWTAAHHRWVLGQQVRRLVDVLAAGGLIDEGQRADLIGRGNRAFAGGYNRGYLEELFWLLGATPPRPGSDAALDLLAACKALRALRDPAGGQIEYRFWKQTLPGPCFDLEHRLPELLAAARAGRADPAVFAAPGVRPDASAGEALDRFVDGLRRLYGRRWRALRPRTWPERVNPALEAEALADVVYVNSEPNDLAAWHAAMTTW